MTNGEKMALGKRSHIFTDAVRIDTTRLHQLSEPVREQYYLGVKRDMARELIDSAIREGYIQFDEHTERTRDENGQFRWNYVCRAWIEVVIPEKRTIHDLSR